MSPGDEPDLTAWIGSEASYVAPEPLGRAAIRYYARAVGDDNPVYTDDAAARAAGHPGVVAPPTLVCETNQFLDRPRPPSGFIGHTWDLPLGEVTLVRGGNRYEFHRALRPDDRVTVRWRLVDLAPKASSRFGRMVVVTSEGTYLDAAGGLLARNLDTTLYVRAGAAHPADEPPPDATEPPGGRDTPAAGGRAETAIGSALPPLHRTLDPAMLVAYAGATWDWYRPHYDLLAARRAGFPGVVVDGQLLGALLAEHVQDWGGPRARLRDLAFRYGAMVLAGDQVQVTGVVTARRATRAAGAEAVVEQRVSVGGRPVIVGARATVTLGEE